jgi:hypothetical protein
MVTPETVTPETVTPETVNSATIQWQLKIESLNIDP